MGRGECVISFSNLSFGSGECGSKHIDSDFSTSEITVRDSSTISPVAEEVWVSSGGLVCVSPNARLACFFSITPYPTALRIDAMSFV